MENVNLEFYCVDESITKEGLSCPNITIETEPVYPSKFFEDNKAKPSITTYPTNDIDILWTKLSQQLTIPSWDDKVMSSFMVGVINEQPELFSVKLTEDWKSYGLTIGNKDDTISPIDILNKVEEGNIGIEDIEKKTSTKEVRLGHFAAIVTIFRKSICRSNNETYGVEIGKRLNSYFGANYHMDEDIYNAYTTFVQSSSLSPNYLKLIAALDMFLFKFQECKGADFRLATLPTRYRGCVSLLSLSQLTSSAGCKVNHLANFVFTRPVAKEFGRVCKTIPGMNDVHGYFPYQLDLKLTPKSPYSMTVNPNLYMWIHTIGCTLGQPRSYTAVFPNNLEDMQGTIISGVATGYALSVGLNFGRFFVEKQEHKATMKAANELIKQRGILNLQSGSVDDDEEDDESETEEEEEEEDNEREEETPEEGQQDFTNMTDETKYSVLASKTLMHLSVKGQLTTNQLKHAKSRFLSCANKPPKTIGYVLYEQFSRTSSKKATSKR